jgi:hypothetical protein
VGRELGREAQRHGRFDGRRGLVALRAGATEALPSVVPVARSRFGQIEVRTEQRTPQRIAEHGISARQLAYERISRDERASRDVERIEPVVCETRVHEGASLARGAGPRRRSRALASECITRPPSRLDSDPGPRAADALAAPPAGPAPRTRPYLPIR